MVAANVNDISLSTHRSKRSKAATTTSADLERVLSLFKEEHDSDIEEEKGPNNRGKKRSNSVFRGKAPGLREISRQVINAIRASD